jgi:hypothetical protein
MKNIVWILLMVFVTWQVWFLFPFTLPIVVLHLSELLSSHN